jgi:MFS transporter, AAHS family, 4-hydroxybenzoate transporter
MNSEIAAATTVDVGALIDDHPLGRWQVWVIVLCGAALFSDGYDTAAMGYVAPALSKLWGLKPGSLGPVFGAALTGLMVGALVLGPLADHIGRRWMIILSTSIFSICTLVTPLVAHDLDSLFWIRFATGLGLGGLTPNAVAVSSEYAPARIRSTLVMTMFVGFISGSALGGVIAASLIPRFGWESVFYCGGAVPLVLVPLLVVALPESIRVLTLRGNQEHRVAALLARINNAFTFHPVRTQFVVPEAKGKGFPVQLLFTDGRAVVTVLLWVMFFVNLLEIYFIANWLPTIASNAGLSQQHAVLATGILYAGGIVSTPVLGLLIDRFGPHRILGATYLLGGLFIAIMGYAVTSDTMLMLSAFCAGACIMGAQNGANAVAAVFYPTAMRSSGVGWANGVGRVGSVVGPVLGGVVIGLHWATPNIFLAAALLTVLATAAVLMVGRLVRGSGVGVAP